MCQKDDSICIEIVPAGVLSELFAFVVKSSYNLSPIIIINFVLRGWHITVKRLTKPWPSNSRSNWNLEMLIFVKGGKPENPEKNPPSKDENQQQTQPTYIGSRLLKRHQISLVWISSVSSLYPEGGALFATTVCYSLFGFSRHPNTNECCRRLQALAAASLIQFQLEKKNDPVHLFWMLYRQASRHTKHRTPHTCASFRPRFHDSWPPSV